MAGFDVQVKGCDGVVRTVNKVDDVRTPLSVFEYWFGLFFQDFAMCLRLFLSWNDLDTPSCILSLS